jgi:hypothetical protein
MNKFLARKVEEAEELIMELEQLRAAGEVGDEEDVEITKMIEENKTPDQISGKIILDFLKLCNIIPDEDFDEKSIDKFDLKDNGFFDQSDEATFNKILKYYKLCKFDINSIKDINVSNETTNLMQIYDLIIIEARRTHSTMSSIRELVLIKRIEYEKIITNNSGELTKHDRFLNNFYKEEIKKINRNVETIQHYIDNEIYNMIQKIVNIYDTMLSKDLLTIETAIPLIIEPFQVFQTNSIQFIKDNVDITDPRIAERLEKYTLSAKNGIGEINRLVTIEIHKVQ